MSKHDTGFIKILVLIFCLGLIQLTNSGCSRWSSDAEKNQIHTDSLSGITQGSKVFDSDLLAKKVFYLALNSNLLKTPLGYAARQESFCTAIAITPSIVLTAAHCVENILPEKINLIEGVSPWLSPLNPGLWHQAEKALTHPKYKSKQPEFDLALLQLNSPLPTNAITAIYEGPTDEMTTTLAGYGFRVRNIETMHTGFKDGNDFLKNNSGELYFLTKLLKSYELEKLTFNFEKSDTENVCIGDSGGPALVYDVETQSFFALGLLSGSIESATANSLAFFADYDFCSGTPVYNNLRHPEIRSWIDRSVSQLTNQLLDGN